MGRRNQSGPLGLVVDGRSIGTGLNKGKGMRAKAKPMKIISPTRCASLPDTISVHFIYRGKPVENKQITSKTTV